MHGPNRIGLIAPPRLAERGDVVDVDAEQWHAGIVAKRHAAIDNAESVEGANSGAIAWETLMSVVTAWLGQFLARAGRRLGSPEMPPYEPPRWVDVRTPKPRGELAAYPRLQRVEDHPTAWAFPTYLDASVPWVATLRELYRSPLAFPASLSPAMGLLLHSLVRNARPRVVVEVGTFLGVSTIWMASALEEGASDPPHLATPPGRPHGFIHCFDDFGPIPPGPWRDASLDRPRDEIVREHLHRAGLGHRVATYPGNSSARLSLEIERGLFGASSSRQPGGSGGATGMAGVGVDLAFIDGDHSVRGAVADFQAVEPVLNTGGYVVLHDTYPEQCGDHEGPRHIIDHLRDVGRGLYELCEIYTAPLNYGMAVLRRVG